MADVTGVVTLQVTVGTDGRVVESRPLEFSASGAVAAMAPTAGAFAGAAVDAVDTWQYEPGKSPVTFMVSLVMRAGGGVDSTSVEAPLKVKDAAVKKTKDVEPQYPPAARQKKIQGVIVLEATAGRDGRVVDCRVLRGIPHLSQAALDAVAQWEFEPGPLFLSSEASSRTFELIVNFKLP